MLMYAFYVPRGLLIQLNTKIKKKIKEIWENGETNFLLAYNRFNSYLSII